jgi:hypothetical protein
MKGHFSVVWRTFGAEDEFNQKKFDRHKFFSDPSEKGDISPKL